MRPSHTGAARYREGCANGQTRQAAPTAIDTAGTTGATGRTEGTAAVVAAVADTVVDTVADRFVGTAGAYALTGFRRIIPRHTATRSAPSKIAGQMVPNDQA